MDPKAAFIFYLLGFICFVVAAFIRPRFDNARWPVWGPELVALGLAFWIFVPLYTAWKAI